MELDDLFTSFIFIFHSIYYFIIRRGSRWCYQSLLSSFCYHCSDKDRNEMLKYFWRQFAGYIQRVFQDLLLRNDSFYLRKRQYYLPSKEKAIVTLYPSCPSTHRPLSYPRLVKPDMLVNERNRFLAIDRQADRSQWETSFEKLLSGAVPEFDSCHDVNGSLWFISYIHSNKGCKKKKERKNVPQYKRNNFTEIL